MIPIGEAVLCLAGARDEFYEALDLNCFSSILRAHKRLKTAKKNFLESSKKCEHLNLIHHRWKKKGITIIKDIEKIKAYTIMQGRPIGRNPEIYLYKPIEIQKGKGPGTWFSEIEEWSSVEKAFKAVFEYCHYRDYKDAIRIVSAPTALEETFENAEEYDFHEGLFDD